MSTSIIVVDETGANEWLIQKPFMFDELVRKVGQVLESDVGGSVT